MDDPGRTKRWERDHEPEGRAEADVQGFDPEETRDVERTAGDRPKARGDRYAEEYRSGGAP